MLRYWAIRRKICTLMKETIELGPFPVDAKESDALCEVVARSVSGCHDVIAILDDVLAARGIHLAEGSDGSGDGPDFEFALKRSPVCRRGP